MERIVPRILHIEDVDALREMIEVYLGLQGFEVTGVASGEAGIRALEESEYDGILLDHHLPGISGERVLGWVSVHRPYLVHRVILTTGSPSTPALEAKLASLQIPALIKPFLLEELLLHLTRLTVPSKARVAAHLDRSAPSGL